MDHVNNAARRSREREKVEGWKLGIQLSHKNDGHCGKKEADRPRRRRRRRLDERITCNRFVYLCIFFFVLHFFPVDNRRNQKEKDSTASKRQKEKKEKRYRNVWLDQQQQHATLSPKITHGSYYTTMDDLFIYLLAQVLTV
jgi:hypothetical protein